jgi:hypothetical protein
LDQSLFLILLLLLLLLMLLPLIAVCRSLTGRQAFAHDCHRCRRFAATINTRTGRAIAWGRLAGSGFSVSILVGGDIYFAVIVFVGFHEFKDLWFGHRQRHVPAGLGHVEFARKQHHEPTGMANAIGDPSGAVAGPPVEIGARRSDDR